MSLKYTGRTKYRYNETTSFIYRLQKKPQCKSHNTSFIRLNWSQTSLIYMTNRYYIVN